MESQLIGLMIEAVRANDVEIDNIGVAEIPSTKKIILLSDEILEGPKFDLNDMDIGRPTNRISAEKQRCINYTNCRFRTNNSHKLLRHQKTCKLGDASLKYQCPVCLKRSDFKKMRNHLYDWLRSASAQKKSKCHPYTSTDDIKKHIEKLNDKKNMISWISNNNI